MASTLECLGFALDGPDMLPSMLEAFRFDAKVLGRVDGVEVLRWEDVASGARVVYGLRGQEVEFLLPSCRAPVCVHLERVRAVNSEVSSAAVVDAEGSQLTALTFEMEERRLLGLRTLDVADAAIVAFGNSVQVHPSVEAFDSSPDSLLDPDGPDEAADDDAFPPRPLRMGAESFFSLGIFGAPKDAVAAARLGGLVLGAETRVNGFSGRPFHAARIRTCEFELLMCISAIEFPEPPPVGGVVTGSAFVAASIPAVGEVRSRRRWWKR